MLIGSTAGGLQTLEKSSTLRTTNSRREPATRKPSPPASIRPTRSRSRLRLYASAAQPTRARPPPSRQPQISTPPPGNPRRRRRTMRQTPPLLPLQRRAPTNGKSAPPAGISPAGSSQCPRIASPDPSAPPPNADLMSVGAHAPPHPAWEA